MRLSVTTPRGAVVEADVEEITAPGAEGEMGILPGHVPLMAALRPGVLVYRTRERATVLAVGEGFLQVSPPPAFGEVAAPGRAAAPAGDRILVLVDRALPLASIDRATAEKDLAGAEGELGAWKGELGGAYQALLVRRDWALARIAATSR